MMPEQQIYEYAVIRVVPRIERDEFFNVGLILFSKKQNFIRIQYDLASIVSSRYADLIDLAYLKTTMNTMKLIANGDMKGGEIASFETPERFRWLTSVRSAALQMSESRTGIATDLNDVFEKLYVELVN